MRDTQHTLKALLTKRAELTDELERRQASVRDCRKDLEHLDGAIRLLNPDAAASTASPKALALAYTTDKGQFAAILFAKLRASQRPCTVKDITAYAMEDRGMDTNDAALVKLMTARTCASLRYYRNRGLLRSTFKPGTGLLWEIAVNDKTEFAN
jgi:hypothetical protein